jgi:hypothetical protein
MFGKFIAAASAGAAMIAAAPAFAADPGGQGRGPPASANVGANAGGSADVGATVRESARINSQGSVNASERATTRANENSAVRSDTNINTRANNRSEPVTGSLIRQNNNTTTRALKSQGPLNANPRAIERASPNSVLVRNSVAATALPGLTTGLQVQTSAGASIGTVSQVITGADGSIRLVIVTSSTGETLRLMPNQLTIAGGVVTTTQAGIGG